MASKQRTSREMTAIDWRWHSDSNDRHARDQITAAACVDIAQTLHRIETLLNQLGVDGIHTLIREQLREVRAVRRARLAAARAERERETRT